MCREESQHTIRKHGSVPNLRRDQTPMYACRTCNIIHIMASKEMARSLYRYPIIHQTLSRAWTGGSFTLTPSESSMRLEAW